MESFRVDGDAHYQSNVGLLRGAETAIFSTLIY